MKNIIIALVIAGTTGFSANAQSQYDQNYKVCQTGGTYKTCGAEPGTASTAKAGSSVRMYTVENGGSKFAKNYKVCQTGNGYAICGEQPNAANATSGAAEENMSVALPVQTTAPVTTTYYNVESKDDATDNENTYTGYYARKHVITVSYESRAPYEGLPSPQYDGPDANRERNLNYNKPGLNLAPSSGSNKGIE